MTDDLIKRIEQAEDALGEASDILEAQAKRIAELEAEATAQCARRIEQYHRAEKAEADLAAARAALVEVLDWTGSDDRDYPEHAPAIAAARGEQPIAEYLDANGAALAALVETDDPVKKCITCSSYQEMYDKCLYPRDGECLPTHQYWQPNSDVCPTCEGNGDISMGNGMYPDCCDCGGTGKKEKTDDQA